MAPIASVIQMRPFRSAPSSRSGSDRPAASRGANSAHSTTVINASTDTKPKLARQPTAWPIRLARGTPMIVAEVRPSITWPIACERRCCGTSEAATSAAMPK